MTTDEIGTRAGPIMAAVALGLAFLLIVLASLYTIRERRHTERAVCQSVVNNRQSDRDTWTTIGMLLRREDMTQEEKERLANFVGAVLAQIPQLTCSGNKPVPKEG